MKWRCRKRAREIASLREDITFIKKALEKARICNFIWVVPYKRGMKIENHPPRPISLETLEKRIQALEDGT